MAAPEDGMKTIEAKVVVLGSQGVGKTSLVIRYVGGMFSKAVSPTIGASFFTYKMTVDNYRVKLQVWDTAGQERFRSMTGQHIPRSLMNQLWTTGWNRKYMAPMYYRKANAAMLMYDITSSDTFYDVKDWVKELKKNVDSPIIMCLLGNKSDLESGRQVKTEDAEEFAQSIEALFYETSALKNTGIEESFLQVAKQLVKMYETQPNSGLNNSSPQESQDIFSTGDNLKLPETTEHTAKQSDNCGC